MSDRLSNKLGELADLDTDRLGARPAPAAELRARGDRQRRRRYAATSIAVAAVVAAVGVSAAALGGSNPTELEPAPSPSTGSPSPTEDAVDEPSPSPTVPATQLSIPEDFPLAASYPETNEDGTPVRVTGRPGVGGVTLCGETILTSSGAAAVAGTKVVNPEDFRARTLLLFEDQADALAVVQQAEQAVNACPTFDLSSFTPVEVPLGDESFGFDQRYESEQGGFDLGLQGYQVVQVGRAVLISTAYGEGNGSPESRTAFSQRLTDDAREVVEAMADARWTG